MEYKFGIALPKEEGSPMHPDEIDVPDTTPLDVYERWYDRQWKAWNDYWKDK